MQVNSLDIVGSSPSLNRIYLTSVKAELEKYRRDGTTAVLSNDDWVTMHALCLKGLSLEELVELIKQVRSNHLGGGFAAIEGDFDFVELDLYESETVERDSQTDNFFDVSNQIKKMPIHSEINLKGRI